MKRRGSYFTPIGWSAFAVFTGFAALALLTVVSVWGVAV